MTLPGPAALEQELKELLGFKVDVVSERGLRERIRDRVLRDAVALWAIENMHVLIEPFVQQPAA